MVLRTPLLTVDVVIIHQERIVLVRRANPPFKGYYALPGGFVEIGERTEDAARREAREETGLDVELVKLLGVYSDVDRDPRGHTVSIAYIGRGRGKPLADTDALSVKLFNPDKLPKKLAFDHEKILKDALRAIQHHKEEINNATIDAKATDL